MVTGSILIIYEGDQARAAEGLKKLETGGLDGDHQENEVKEECAQAISPPFLVKIVDFAHIQIVSGQGPDTGVLKGLDTILDLLDGRTVDVSTMYE